MLFVKAYIRLVCETCFAGLFIKENKYNLDPASENTDPI